MSSLEQTTITGEGFEVLPCGCRNAVRRTGSRSSAGRCETGEGLRGELMRARDAHRAGPNARHRDGRENRDAFVAARAAYRGHVFGEAS